MRSKISDFPGFYLRASGWAFMGPLLPWACTSARSWAPRGSTLLFVPRRSTESAPARVMTTMQPILALRHVYEPAVQLYRTDSVVSAMANSTLGSPHHHLFLRRGKCAGLESRSNPSSPRFDPRQPRPPDGRGKVRLPPPPQPNLEYRQLLEGSDSDAKAFRENARSYNNALSFTSLAAHWDQTQVGTLGPPVFRVFGRLYHRLGALIPAVNQRPAFAQTWLIDPAEATNTRLQGPDSTETRIQRSTLTKLQSMLRTGNRFVREFASAKARAGWDTAKEWVLRLCLPPGRDRRTHNLPTSSTEMAMLICDSDTNTGDRGPQDLILQVHGDRCPDGRPKYQVVSSLHPSVMPLRYPLLFPAGEDGFHPNIPLCGSDQAGPPIARNREQIDNGVQLREVLAGLGLDDEDEQEDEDRDNEDEDGEEGDEEDGDGERQANGSRCQDRLTQHIRLHQDNLRLTTTQGINGLTPNQIATSRSETRMRWPKSGNKRHAGCFGDECRMNVFRFFAVFRIVYS
ncbi:BQ5605_C026g10246 [Microbotryum silenes-dioicae]|uniref:BQ5605_C026g10246 protein n=1 Tax=Microbotryum silenes-dioicae TaxID=796604 RepID=A0A2X0MQN7_9BASI|nr:BQ5605_C026g10246 [Microbotryum silenes-dioicae]